MGTEVLMSDERPKEAAVVIWESFKPDPVAARETREVTSRILQELLETRRKTLKPSTAEGSCKEVCSDCGREAGFSCRLHYVNRIEQLTAALSEMYFSEEYTRARGFEVYCLGCEDVGRSMRVSAREDLVHLSGCALYTPPA